MRTTKPVKDPLTTVLRWNGQEVRYNERDRDFVHEVLAHQFGFKNAGIVQIQQTSNAASWQIVIVDVNPNDDHTEEQLSALLQAATTEQKGFMITYKTEDYDNIVKARNRNRGNVFDLFMGYNEDFDEWGLFTDDEDEPTPA